MDYMRTTVDIPDETYRRLKMKAVEEGTPVREIVLRGIAHELEPSKTQRVRKLKLPLIHSKRPGTLHLTNDQIDDILFS
jgi:hypothetical protein